MAYRIVDAAGLQRGRLTGLVLKGEDQVDADRVALQISLDQAREDRLVAGARFMTRHPGPQVEVRRILLDPPGWPGCPQGLPHWPYLQAFDQALTGRGSRRARSVSIVPAARTATSRCPHPSGTAPPRPAVRLTSQLRSMDMRSYGTVRLIRDVRSRDAHWCRSTALFSYSYGQVVCCQR